MKNLSMYCLSLNPDHLHFIKKLNCIPVGLGNANFSSEWLNDKTSNNISNKNPYYGEYTFHYSIWKELSNNINTEWVGFCQYRKFWTLNPVAYDISNFDDLKNKILKKIPDNIDFYESILGDPFYINQFRFSKFMKRNFLKMIKNPSLLFFKNKRNIRFHFDMWHGDSNLDKAIELLNDEEKDDFKKFVNTKVYFNPHNMFICKKEYLLKYYDSVFPWLEKCESIFGFENTADYGKKRIYGFLAERYLSYWFSKYTKHTTLPIYFKDLGDFNYKNL